MNPLILQSLLALGPSLISKLFGGDARKKLMDQIAKLQAQQPGLGKQYYNQNLGSPAYNQALGTIAAGGNAAGNQVASSLAQRGIGTSGSAAVLQGLVPSMVGQQRAGLLSQAYNEANQRAGQDINSRINTLTGTYGQPSQTQQLFGTGLEAILPLLLGGGAPQTIFGGGLPTNALLGASNYQPTPPAPRTL